MTSSFRWTTVPRRLRLPPPQPPLPRRTLPLNRHRPSLAKVQTDHRSSTVCKDRVEGTYLQSLPSFPELCQLLRISVVP